MLIHEWIDTYLKLNVLALWSPIKDRSPEITVRGALQVKNFSWLGYLIRAS